VYSNSNKALANGRMTAFPVEHGQQAQRLLAVATRRGYSICLSARRITMSKTMKPLRTLLSGFLCIALLVAPVPRASAATLAEYGALLVLIVVLIGPVSLQADLPEGWQVVVNHLDTAVEGARAANMVGNRLAELSRLSKAIGAAEALMGMTSDCDECGDLRDVLQQIIGQAALLKTSAVGASGTCQPNGIIGPTEQCDPLAASTGCPVNTIAPTYCSDECRCEIAPAP
jgi:hypothetical protein